MRNIVATAVVCGLLTGCATNGERRDLRDTYSAQERASLTLCMGMSDTAWSVANQKNAGASLESVKAAYAMKPRAAINVATVEKVFADDTSRPWDYTVAFFHECAANVAKVPASRSGMAAYCLQNAMIADVAFGYRSTGAAKSEAYRQFSAFGSETPRTIIDRVYASSAGRVEAKMSEWDSCMGALSR